MTRILPVSEVKANLYQLIQRVSFGDEIIVTRNGKPKAALLSAEQLDSLKETLDVLSDPNLMRQIRSGERQLRQGGRLHSFEDVFGEPLVPLNKGSRLRRKRR